MISSETAAPNVIPVEESEIADIKKLSVIVFCPFNYPSTNKECSSPEFKKENKD